MTTYNTGNPVPSGDARDRFDNSQTLDEAINGAMPSTVTRTGKVIKTLEGMQQEFKVLIDGFGFNYAGPYTAGTVLLSHLSYVEVGGLAYVLKSDVPVPYTLTGNWASESVNFKLAGDSVLRTELAASGPNLVNPSVVGATSPDANSVAITLRQVLDNRNAYPFQFGAVGNGIADDTAAWQKALANGKLIDGLGKTYKISSILEIPSDRIIVRAKFIQSGGSVDNMSMIQMTGLSGIIKQNIHFIDVHLDGNRQAQTNIGFGESGDGQRHGFYIKGQARNIRLTRCSAKNCATDGLSLFGAAAAVTFAIREIVLDQCDFQVNRRHGVAMDSLYVLKAYGGFWTENGNDLSGASGQPITSGYYGARVGDVSGPQYGNGCDIESYGADINGSTHVEDVEFHGVHMAGNYSGGLKVLTMPGSDYNGAPGYTRPNWAPHKNIKVFGGRYDVGLNGQPSAETSPIQIGAAGLLPDGVFGVVDLYVHAASCSSSIAINNAKRVRFNASIDTLNGGTFKYHAFVGLSDDYELDLLTPQPLAVYQPGLAGSINKPMTGRLSPTVSVAGGAIASQTTTLLSSNTQSGQLFRINISANLTLVVGNTIAFTVLGFRTVLDVHGAASDTSTQAIYPVFYSEAGLAIIKPATQASLDIVLYVTVV